MEHGRDKAPRQGSRHKVHGAGNTKELKKILDARLRGHDGKTNGVR
jgi:hypothetical protein